MQKYFASVLPFNPIDVCHSSHLEEGYDEQRQRSDVGVEDLQPVVPRAQGEDQGRSEAEQTYQTYKQQGTAKVSTTSLILTACLYMIELDERHPDPESRPIRSLHLTHEFITREHLLRNPGWD